MNNRSRHRSSSSSSDDDKTKRYKSKNRRSPDRYSKSTKSSKSSSQYKSRSSKSRRRSRSKDRSSSRKRSRSRDHHRSSKPKHRRSRSRSYIREFTSKSKRHTSTSSSSSESTPPATPKNERKPTNIVAKIEQLTVKSRNKSPEVKVNVDVLNDINSEDFAPKSFSSSSGKLKKLNNIVIDLRKQTIKVPEVEPVEPDSIFHHNLFLNEEARTEKWIKELYGFRQKALQQGLIKARIN